MSLVLLLPGQKAARILQDKLSNVNSKYDISFNDEESKGGEGEKYALHIGDKINVTVNRSMIGNVGSQSVLRDNVAENTEAAHPKKESIINQPYVKPVGS